MKPINAQLAYARETLAPVAGKSAALEARLLAQHAWGMSAETLVARGDEAVESAPLEPLLTRRLSHEPIAQILGVKEFWKDSFRVTRDVLTPRADSETMIEVLLRLRADKNAPLRMLDLGTGSGCLLLSALREYPSANGVGVDRSELALVVANHNATTLQLATRSEFCCSEWCNEISGTFDVVLANPPYIPTADIATLAADVRLHEPHGALDGGVDGLECYRSILQQLPRHVNQGALILFEVGQAQAAAVAALGRGHCFRYIDTTPDLAGIPRIVALEFHS